MKAVLYAVKRDIGWEARVSVAWEVDRSYWADSDFRRTAAAGWERGDRNVGESRQLVTMDESRCTWVRLNETLPLGIAVMACDRWLMQAGAGHRDPRRRLLAAAKWAAAQAGDLDKMRWNRLEVIEEGERRDLAERRGLQREEFPELPRLAREAASRLRGCGLLLAEAMSALDTDSAALLPALQLAALLGGVRITSAVGSVRRRTGFGWLRGRTTEMCCRRCGSSGPALHRTPCAACGRRSCAYCEACLTMGRSRECGLLVIGAPADAVRSADHSLLADRLMPSLYAMDANRGNVAPHSAKTQWRNGQSCASGHTSEDRPKPPQVPARWGLSPAQQEAAETALAFLLKHRNERASLMRMPAGSLAAGRRCFLERTTPRGGGNEFLLWAVTGAGKTEMMFPLLEAVLTAGGKVAVATPRRDVVLELAPRLAVAFPQVRRVVLYGGSEDRLQLGDLTLATTHQLIRFKEAFDLVVIDEVDAFPFHNDPALHFAAKEARARSGMTLLLSATPPAAMQRRARRGQLAHARVAVRHHRRPLPVPQRLTIPPLSRWISGDSVGLPAAESGPDPAVANLDSDHEAKNLNPRHTFGAPRSPSRSNAPVPRLGHLPVKLREAIRDSIRRGAQLFLFVPFIRQVEPLVRLLRPYAASFGIDPAAIDGTSSQDPLRGDKVTAFRDRSIRLLVTTTILERGVTVPKSDVFVLDADKPLFDAASLVQMAGRAGRSADDPDGRVIFAASAWTNSQRGACKQIREMNAYARRKGFLLEAAPLT